MDTGYIAEQMGYWLLPVLFTLLCIRSIKNHGVHKGSLTLSVIIGLIGFMSSYIYSGIKQAINTAVSSFGVVYLIGAGIAHRIAKSKQKF